MSTKFYTATMYGFARQCYAISKKFESKSFLLGRRKQILVISQINKYSVNVEGGGLRALEKLHPATFR